MGRSRIGRERHTQGIEIMTKHRRTWALGAPVAAVAGIAVASASAQDAGFLYRIHQPDGTVVDAQSRGVHSIAREWNDVLLEAIRNDKARPTVHGRNLYHTSAAMWDAWAAYDTVADQVFHSERQTAVDVPAARDEAISYAMYRIMIHRFTPSVGAAETLPLIEAQMSYPTGVTTTIGDTPAALGNRIAETIINFGSTDGANEANDYENLYYEAVNAPLFPDLPGNPDITDPNRWQPLAIKYFVDQSGNPIPLGSLDFLSPEWGHVTGFALHAEDRTDFSRDGDSYPVFHDPGDPPYFNGVGDAYYRSGNEMVISWSNHLDPTDGVMIDISPGSIGNSPLPGVNDWPTYYDFFNGGDSGTGWALNPVTLAPYPAQNVPRGDYGRILAEFWADGPDSETPPGHWFTIANYVNDHPLFEKRLGGVGPILDDLEWDVKLYLAMGGMMHDCAVTAWGCKGWYDYIRPISAVRFMGDNGQSSDPLQPSYNASGDGITLYPDLIEVCTAATTLPGERHEHLAGNEGKIVVKAWRGPDYIVDELVDEAGVGWILLEEWWPYQRPSFVTPPFAGYVSGHSTFSRGASEIMTWLTGTEFFPGGVGEFFAPMNEFLVFEDGPSQDITLQWATYRDASDQTSLSRIWGGIHPPADDLPGRIMGEAVAKDAWALARRYYSGQVSCPADYDGNRSLDFTDVIGFLTAFGSGDLICDIAAPYREVDFSDVLAFLTAFGAGCP